MAVVDLEKSSKRCTVSVYSPNGELVREFDNCQSDVNILNPAGTVFSFMNKDRKVTVVSTPMIIVEEK